jgi:2',3'-cyclic-nucleotide 2'-phosphodiesterase (5'-nucleotidase family)
LTGEQVRGLLEQNAASPHQLLQLSGLSVHFDLRQPPGSRVIKVMVGHEPLAPGKIYRVATNDFLAAGGDAITLFKADSYPYVTPWLWSELRLWV